MPDNANYRHVTAEEMFAWAELTIILLDRIIVILGMQDLSDDHRLDLRRRALELESVFVTIGAISEIEDDANLMVKELANHIDRLRELITTTHEMIDRIIEPET